MTAAVSVAALGTLQGLTSAGHSAALHQSAVGTTPGIQWDTKGPFTGHGSRTMQ